MVTLVFNPFFYDHGRTSRQHSHTYSQTMGDLGMTISFFFLDVAKK